MIYLKSFKLLSREDEEDFFLRPTRETFAKTRRTCYTTKYPFGVFRTRELPVFSFEPLTILYGGNGSGKSTVLNVLAEKLRLRRGAVFNRGDFFEDYVARCKVTLARGTAVPADSRIITSDDVFDRLLDIRCLNDGIDSERAKLLERYAADRAAEGSYLLKSLDDYDEWKQHGDAKTKSQSQYVRERLARNVQERSNGESALSFFTEAIQENALYLLDEPENSLSAALQMELKRFLEDSARHFGCQFVISTHSPFLLAMPGAKIYDLDAQPPEERPWTALENVRTYYEFFKAHSGAFEGGK